MPAISGFRKKPQRQRAPVREASGDGSSDGNKATSRTLADDGYKHLHLQVKESSDNNRQFFFAYLALMVFVQSMVIATTDKMLLLSHEGIKLPLVDLMVPLLGFYWVVPFFVLALHFNFLHNLDSHHYKLMQWRYAFPNACVPRSQVHAFLFDFAVLERDTSMATILHAINAFLCLYLGPVTLALVLWRMTDYQDAGLTSLHTIVFLINCGLVWKTSRGFRANASAPPENLQRCADEPSAAALHAAVLPSKTMDNGHVSIARWLLRGLIMLCMLFVLVQAALGIAIAKLPSEQFSQWFGAMPSARPNTLGGHILEMMLPRLNIDPGDIIFEVNEGKMKTFAELAGQKDWVKWFHQSGMGLDLRDRSLRGAQISHQFMPRALFEGSQLEGANFAETQLHGANFWLAQLQGADFSRAKLPFSTFWFAKLQKAIFRDADLQHANFEFAQLYRASFYAAYLYRAEFTQSAPQHVDFRFSHIEGGIFTSAQLERSDFGSAMLEGAVFHGAQLLGADFSEAKLAGAIFDNVQLQGTIGLHAEMPLLGNGPTQHSITAFNWQKERQKARDILDPQMRQDYLDNLQQSEKRALYQLDDLPRAQHAMVAKAWMADFCPEANNNKEMDEKFNGAVSLLQMASNSESDKQLGRSAALAQFKTLLCRQAGCRALTEKLIASDAINCQLAASDQSGGSKRSASNVYVPHK